MRRGRLLQLALVCGALLLGLAAAGPTAADDVPASDSITQLPDLALAPGASQTFTGQNLHLAAAPPRADILIALDTTGSMNAAIVDAKNDAVSMVNQIKASIPDARFAVASFKDYAFAPFGIAGDYPWRVDQGFTSNDGTVTCGDATVTPVECALDSLSAGGGNDIPEAYNRAFYEAYNDTEELSWRANTQRFMVVLGDSVPHDASFHTEFSNCADTPPTDPGPDETQGTGDDLRTLPTLTALKAAHTNLSFVTYNPTAAVVACQSDLAAFTGGSEVTHDAGTATLGSQIVSLIRQAAANIDTVSFRVTGFQGESSFDATNWVTTSPATFGPAVAPIDLGFAETVSVPAGTALGTYGLRVDAVVDGSVRASQTFSVDVRALAVSALQITADQSSNVPGIAQIPLSSIPVSRIPAFAGGPVTTPGGSIPGGSIPGGSIPGGSIPGGSIPGGSIPGGSITFGDLGLAGGLPGGSIPGGSIPGGSIPGGSIGFRNALQSVLLSQIPLANPPNATWPAVLAGTPLDGRPLNTVTLYEVTQNAQAWSRLAALPVRDVPFLTSLWGGAPLAAWLLGNTPLANLPPPGGGTWASALDSNGGSSAGLDTSTNTVFGVAVAGQLGTTNIGSIPGGSIPGGSIVGGTIPARAIPLNQIVAKSRLATVPLSSISPLGGVVLCGAFNCNATGATLGDAAAAGSIDSNATYGLLLDRVSDPNSPAKRMTISELIFAFLPASLYPWEQLNLQGLQDVGGTNKNVDYHVDFGLNCAVAPSFSVRVRLPSGEFVVPGSSSFSFGGGANQASSNPTFDSEGGSFSWTPPAGVCPAGSSVRSVRLNFSAYERLAVGAHTASATVIANNLSTSTNEQAPVDVVQAGEPNDTPAAAPTLQKDVLYVGHLAYAGDQDVYSIPLGGYPRGTKLRVSMKVPGDFDLVLTKPNSPSVRSSPGGSIPGGSIPLENPTPAVDSSGTPLPPDTLADVPQSAPGGSIPGGSIPGGSIPGGSIPGGSISANRGNVSEAAQIVTNGETGNAFVTVSGYNAAFSANPYVLRLQVTPPPTLPPCPAVTGLAAPAPGTLPAASSLPSDTQTLFLVNRQRMAALHDGSNTLSINSLLSTGSSLLQVAARPEVKGAILPVDGNATVRSAYANWDANPCSIDAVNGVVKSINDLVDTYRAALPNVKYVVVLGDDRAIPSWRQYDRVSISPELDEAAELQNFTDANRPNNPLYAAAAQNYVLTDGAYGVRTRITWLGADLPLPQDSVSRFVESTDDVNTQLQAYAASNGVLNPQSQFVSDDDFFADSASATDRALQGGFPGAADDFLYPPNRGGWTRDDFIAHFFSKKDASGNPLPVPDIGGLYAHYNPWLAQPAAPTPPTALDQLVSSADASASPALRNHILFTIGCHSGLNIPDGYPLLPGSQASRHDWAQTYAQGGAATYIANTGFGYDDTDSVALSGRLMTLFAKKLNRGSGSIGQQWIDALDTYYRTAGDWDVLDEKVMLQATFYGPPWAHFQSPQPKPSPPALTTHNVTNPDGSTLKVATLPTIAPTIHANAGSNGGTWWDVNGETLSVPFRPIQPLYTQDVTIPGLTARDAFITSLTVNDLLNQKPVRARPVIERAAYEPDPNFRNIFWPATPTTVLRSAFGDTLNVVVGQFRPVSADLSTGIERQIQSIGVDVGYSSATDTIRPLISQVTGVMTSPTRAHIVVRVTDNSITVAKVAVLYNDGAHNFRYLELTRTFGDLWEGDTANDLTGPPEILAEARDPSGNVGMSANKAVNFTAITDNSAPSITIENPLANAVVTLGQQLPARFFCSDAGGVKTCDGSSPNGSSVDTTTVGTHTFTVTATDFANHTTTQTVTYVVRYGFSGFLAPVDNPPTVNQVKAGQTVPIKWDLKDAAGNVKNDLAAVTSIRWDALRCPTATGDPDPETVSPGLSGLKIMGGHFQYNWSTLTSWVGTCKSFSVTFTDQTTKTAYFQFK